MRDTINGEKKIVPGVNPGPGEQAQPSVWPTPAVIFAQSTQGLLLSPKRPSLERSKGLGHGRLK
jgi:hypothetical protein